MEISYYKLDYQRQANPDVYRNAILLTYLMKLYLALLLILVYLCLAAF